MKGAQIIDILDIGPFLIGQTQNEQAGTGCTVVIAPKGAVGGVDVRGGGPATRETDLLDPVNLVESLHAVVLSGGSAYGLDAAGGVMRFLEKKNIGFPVGDMVVPIVSGASLFDLIVGDGRIRPDMDMGYRACETAFAGEPLKEGNYGAGTGATVGKYMGLQRMMKSGIGHFALQAGDLKVGAIVAVNALGDILDCDSRRTLAGVLEADGRTIGDTCSFVLENQDPTKNVFSGNTTIGCVLTNAKLTKPQANKLASVAQNGYADVIRPVHTMSDGDTVFVMASGDADADPLAVGILAREAVARAINRAVLAARTAYGIVCASDFLPDEQ